MYKRQGCDKVIHSAVVEEKDKTAAKKEENKEKETVQKTVTEQVQAPKTYQTTIPVSYTHLSEVFKIIPETVDIAYRFLYYIDNRYIDNLYNGR